ncbi:MAG: divalent-cation tolerance protein CutA [Bdellovibrionaceae bacterium]|nr:divalent-cation tolerance protein CutA [Pseudobdellovibrionaceae bacterium]
MDSRKIVIVYVTCPSFEAAQKIAELAVRESLAACANVITGVHSVYKWKGSIEKSSETILILKTLEQCTDKLTAMIQENHPYEVPAILVFDATSANELWTKWARSEVLS